MMEAGVQCSEADLSICDDSHASIAHSSESMPDLSNKIESSVTNVDEDQANTKDACKPHSKSPVHILNSPTNSGSGIEAEKPESLPLVVSDKKMSHLNVPFNTSDTDVCTNRKTETLRTSPSSSHVSSSIDAKTVITTSSQNLTEPAKSVSVVSKIKGRQPSEAENERLQRVSIEIESDVTSQESPAIVKVQNAPLKLSRKKKPVKSPAYKIASQRHKLHGTKMTALLPKKRWSEKVPRVIDNELCKQWIIVIKQTGCVTCPVPSCERIFDRLKFIKWHYKWCMANAPLGKMKCPYCVELVDALDGDIVYHVRRKHGEVFSEYLRIFSPKITKFKPKRSATPKKEVGNVTPSSKCPSEIANMSSNVTLPQCEDSPANIPTASVSDTDGIHLDKPVSNAESESIKASLKTPTDSVPLVQKEQKHKSRTSGSLLKEVQVFDISIKPGSAPNPNTRVQEIELIHSSPASLPDALEIPMDVDQCASPSYTLISKPSLTDVIQIESDTEQSVETTLESQGSEEFPLQCSIENSLNSTTDIEIADEPMLPVVVDSPCIQDDAQASIPLTEHAVCDMEIEHVEVTDHLSGVREAEIIQTDAQCPLQISDQSNLVNESQNNQNITQTTDSSFEQEPKSIIHSVQDPSQSVEQSVAPQERQSTQNNVESSVQMTDQSVLNVELQNSQGPHGSVEVTGNIKKSAAVAEKTTETSVPTNITPLVQESRFVQQEGCDPNHTVFLEKAPCIQEELPSSSQITDQNIIVENDQSYVVEDLQYVQQQAGDPTQITDQSAAEVVQDVQNSIQHSDHPNVEELQCVQQSTRQNPVQIAEQSVASSSSSFVYSDSCKDANLEAQLGEYSHALHMREHTLSHNDASLSQIEEGNPYMQIQPCTSNVYMSLAMSQEDYDSQVLTEVSPLAILARNDAISGSLVMTEPTEVVPESEVSIDNEELGTQVFTELKPIHLSSLKSKQTSGEDSASATTKSISDVLSMVSNSEHDDSEHAEPCTSLQTSDSVDTDIPGTSDSQSSFDKAEALDDKQNSPGPSKSETANASTSSTPQGQGNVAKRMIIVVKGNLTSDPDLLAKIRDPSLLAKICMLQKPPSKPGPTQRPERGAGFKIIVPEKGPAKVEATGVKDSPTPPRRRGRRPKSVLNTPNSPSTQPPEKRQKTMTKNKIVSHLSGEQQDDFVLDTRRWGSSKRQYTKPEPCKSSTGTQTESYGSFSTQSISSINMDEEEIKKESSIESSTSNDDIRDAFQNSEQGTSGSIQSQEKLSTLLRTYSRKQPKVIFETEMDLNPPKTENRTPSPTSSKPQTRKTSVRFSDVVEYADNPLKDTKLCIPVTGTKSPSLSSRFASKRTFTCVDVTADGGNVKPEKILKIQEKISVEPENVLKIQERILVKPEKSIRTRETRSKLLEMKEQQVSNVKVTVEADKTEAAEDVSKVQIPVKRGRGRPRKNPLPPAKTPETPSPSNNSDSTPDLPVPTKNPDSVRCVPGRRRGRARRRFLNSERKAALYTELKMEEEKSHLGDSLGEGTKNDQINQNVEEPSKPNMSVVATKDASEGEIPSITSETSNSACLTGKDLSSQESLSAEVSQRVSTEPLTSDKAISNESVDANVAMSNATLNSSTLGSNIEENKNDQDTQNASIASNNNVSSPIKSVANNNNNQSNELQSEIVSQTDFIASKDIDDNQPMDSGAYAEIATSKDDVNVVDNSEDINNQNADAPLDSKKLVERDNFDSVDTDKDTAIDSNTENTKKQIEVENYSTCSVSANQMGSSSFVRDSEKQIASDNHAKAAEKLGEGESYSKNSNEQPISEQGESASYSKDLVQQLPCDSTAKEPPTQVEKYNYQVVSSNKRDFEVQVDFGSFVEDSVVKVLAKDSEVQVGSGRLYNADSVVKQVTDDRVACSKKQTDSLKHHTGSAGLHEGDSVMMDAINVHENSEKQLISDSCVEDSKKQMSESSSMVVDSARLPEASEKQVISDDHVEDSVKIPKDSEKEVVPGDHTEESVKLLKDSEKQVISDDHAGDSVKFPKDSEKQEIPGDHTEVSVKRPEDSEKEVISDDHVENSDKLPRDSEKQVISDEDSVKLPEDSEMEATSDDHVTDSVKLPEDSEKRVMSDDHSEHFEKRVDTAEFCETDSMVNDSMKLPEDPLNQMAEIHVENSEKQVDTGELHDEGSVMVEPVNLSEDVLNEVTVTDHVAEPEEKVDNSEFCNADSMLVDLPKDSENQVEVTDSPEDSAKQVDASEFCGVDSVVVESASLPDAMLKEVTVTSDHVADPVIVALSEHSVNEVEITDNAEYCIKEADSSEFCKVDSVVVDSVNLPEDTVNEVTVTDSDIINTEEKIVSSTVHDEDSVVVELPEVSVNQDAITVIAENPEKQIDTHGIYKENSVVTESPNLSDDTMKEVTLETAVTDDHVADPVLEELPGDSVDQVMESVNPCEANSVVVESTNLSEDTLNKVTVTDRVPDPKEKAESSGFCVADSVIVELPEDIVNQVEVTDNAEMGEFYEADSVVVESVNLPEDTLNEVTVTDHVANPELCVADSGVVELPENSVNQVASTADAGVTVDQLTSDPQPVVSDNQAESDIQLDASGHQVDNKEYVTSDSVQQIECNDKAEETISQMDCEDHTVDSVKQVDSGDCPEESAMPVVCEDHTEHSVKQMDRGGSLEESDMSIVCEDHTDYTEIHADSEGRAEESYEKTLNEASEKQVGDASHPIDSVEHTELDNISSTQVIKDTQLEESCKQMGSDDYAEDSVNHPCNSEMQIDKECHSENLNKQEVNDDDNQDSEKQMASDHLEELNINIVCDDHPVICEEQVNSDSSVKNLRETKASNDKTKEAQIQVVGDDHEVSQNEVKNDLPETSSKCVTHSTDAVHSEIQVHGEGHDEQSDSQSINEDKIDKFCTQSVTDDGNAKLVESKDSIESASKQVMCNDLIDPNSQIVKSKEAEECNIESSDAENQMVIDEFSEDHKEESDSCNIAKNSSSQVGVSSSHDIDDSKQIDSSNRREKSVFLKTVEESEDASCVCEEVTECNNQSIFQGPLASEDQNVHITTTGLKPDVEIPDIPSSLKCKEDTETQEVMKTGLNTETKDHIPSNTSDGENNNQCSDMKIVEDHSDQIASQTDDCTNEFLDVEHSEVCSSICKNPEPKLGSDCLDIRDSLKDTKQNDSSLDLTKSPNQSNDCVDAKSSGDVVDDSKDPSTSPLDDDCQDTKSKQDSDSLGIHKYSKPTRDDSNDSTGSKQCDGGTNESTDPKSTHNCPEKSSNSQQIASSSDFPQDTEASDSTIEGETVKRVGDYKEQKDAAVNTDDSTQLSAFKAGIPCTPGSGNCKEKNKKEKDSSQSGVDSANTVDKSKEKESGRSTEDSIKHQEMTVEKNDLSDDSNGGGDFPPDDDIPLMEAEDNFDPSPKNVKHKRAKSSKNPTVGCAANPTSDDSNVIQDEAEEQSDRGKKADCTSVPHTPRKRRRLGTKKLHSNPTNITDTTRSKAACKPAVAADSTKSIPAPTHRRRGRPKRQTTMNLPAEGSFRCGECQLIFPSKSRIRYHIYAEHAGMAKINDDTPMTEEDKLTASKQAFKFLKFLKCVQCKQKYASYQGWQTHIKACGKERIRIACDICGAMMLEAQLPVHKKKKHPADVPKKTRSVKEEEPLKTKETPKRQSALSARKKFQELAGSEDPCDDVSSSEDWKMETDTEDDDDEDEDYYEYIDSDSDEQEVVAEGDREERKQIRKPTNTTNPPLEQIIEELKTMQGLFIPPKVAHLRSISSQQKMRWKEEMAEKGVIKCQDCNKELMSELGMHYHWRRCGQQQSHWQCNICGLILKRGPRTMLRHLQQNHKDSEKNLTLETADKAAAKPSGTSIMPPRRSFGGGSGGRENGLDPYLPAFEWTLERHKKHLQETVFPEWGTSKRLFLRLNQNEYAPYIPHTRESASFVIKKTENDNNKSDVETPWQKLQLFETYPPEGDPYHQSFFVGGPVYASAWCPTPLNSVAKQYLAIASCLSMDVVHPMTDTDSERGLIQFWDIGYPSIAGFSSNPCVTLALAHGYGVIWDMEWCPGGAWESPEIPSAGGDDSMPRLGLLALACGDGNVRILSIPHPDYLHDGLEPLPVYRTQPVAVLQAPGTGPAFDNQLTSCGSVSWMKTEGKERIAGGYRSGLVCIWNVKSRATLIVVAQNKNQVILRPFLIFQAHGASVSRVKWSPIVGGRFLATGGFDRAVKIWDLEDTSIPIMVTKKGLITDIAWCSHWNGVFAATDECYNISHTHTFYKECGYYDFHPRVLSAHNSCTWSIDVSDWLNAEASGDEAGEVIVTVLCQLMKNVDTIKQMSHRRMPVYRIDWQSLKNVDQSGTPAENAPKPAPSKAKQRKSATPRKNVKNSASKACDDVPDSSNSASVNNVQADSASNTAAIKQPSTATDNNATATQTAATPASLPSVNSNPAFRDMSLKSYHSVTDAYGLVFHDAPVNDVKSIPQECLKRLVKPDTMNYHLPNKFPLSSIYCVKWNPNLGAHLWLFTIGQAGIGRISCLSGLHKKEVENFIAKKT